VSKIDLTKYQDTKTLYGSFKTKGTNYKVDIPRQVKGLCQQEFKAKDKFEFLVFNH